MHQVGELFNSFEFVEAVDVSPIEVPLQIDPQVRYDLISYTHVFHLLESDHSGYSFSLNAGGELLNPESAANYNDALQRADRGELIDGGISVHRRVYYDAATKRCVCGAVVALENGWVNECEMCGREYNGSGTLLNPRHLWGEETNETF